MHKSRFVSLEESVACYTANQLLPLPYLLYHIKQSSSDVVSQDINKPIFYDKTSYWDLAHFSSC